MHVVHSNSSLSGSGGCYDVNMYLCLHESLQNYDSSLSGVRQQMGIDENKRLCHLSLDFHSKPFWKNKKSLFQAQGRELRFD